MLNYRIAIITTDPYASTVLWPHLLEHIAKVDLFDPRNAPASLQGYMLVLADKEIDPGKIRGLGRVPCVQISTREPGASTSADTAVLQLDARISETVARIKALVTGAPIDRPSAEPLPERVPGPVPDAVAEALRSTYSPPEEETEPSRLRQLIDRFTS